MKTATAPPKSLQHAWRDACIRATPLLAVYACSAALVVAVGVSSLVEDSVPRRLVESWINIHLVFGLLLCGVVVAEYRRRAAHAPGVPALHGRELCRYLSRIVYLALYVVIGVRECISLAISIRHGGTGDFNLLDASFRAGPDSRAFDPHNDFQMFLASGLIALIVVRALVFRGWLRASAA